MRRILIPYLAAAAIAAAADEPAPTPTPVDNTDEVLRVGQELFDQFAPPEIKEQYSFPTREDWDRFAVRLQRAMDGDSLQDLSLPRRPEAAPRWTPIPIPPRATRTMPTGWRYGSTTWRPRSSPRRTAPRPLPRQADAAFPRRFPTTISGCGGKADARRLPSAAELMPQLRQAFEAEGIPPQLAWVAEVESNLNPAARSPAGAKGLFQLMPETAHLLGLSTFLPDERSEPGKSAHAAAKYLHMLFAKFGSWPLALAAYNAGEGRVSRLMAARGAADFAGVSSGRPAETRMYVPKVCALVTVRTGATL